MTTTNSKAPSCFDTAEYWEKEARNYRAFALEERERRRGSVESIDIYERTAMDCEARAKAIRERT